MPLIGKAEPRSADILKRVADIVGCEPAVIDAILAVETAHDAFDPMGRLVIRPEAHKVASCPYLTPEEKKRAAKLGFTKQPKLVGYHINPVGAGTAAWDYVDRLADAFGEDVAYYVTSFGTPQIMGFNFQICGYKSVLDMVRSFADSEDDQLLAMGKFLDKTGLREACQQRKWKQIARAYNGKNYAQNNYDARLELAYERSTAEKGFKIPFVDDVLEFGEKGIEVKNLQLRLRELGYYVDADGDFGAETRDAVRALQFRQGVPVDGKVGERTRAALANASPKPPNDKPIAAIVAESKTAQSAISTMVTGAVGGVVATVNAVVNEPPPVPVPVKITDVESVLKMTEQGTTLTQKILSIGVDKILIALAVGAVIFGAIALWRRIEAQRLRKVG